MKQFKAVDHFIEGQGKPFLQEKQVFLVSIPVELHGLLFGIYNFGIYGLFYLSKDIILQKHQNGS